VIGSAGLTEEPTPVANRRRFLKWLTALGGLGAAVLAGGPALASFLSPAFRRKPARTWVSLGDVGRFEPEVPTQVDFAQTVGDAWVETRTVRTVWVYTDDGSRFNVYDARCTHLGCTYAWVKENGVFQCPCHYGRFDPRTGAVVSGPPPRPLIRLETKIEADVLYTEYPDS
jgi:menaquinol-cytochrome c reductase iron-sulfur subunit